MNDDVTPINARPKRRHPEAFEDASLALREHLVWPVEDWFLGLSDRGRAAVAGGAVVAVLGLGIGASSLGGAGNSEPASATVAAVPQKTAPSTPSEPAEPEAEPTLHGAAPVFKSQKDEGQAKVGGSEGVGSESAPAAPAANTGDPATDTFSSSPAARPAANASNSASTSSATVDGPPAGPAAIAVAHKFADAFVVYETGGDEDTVRKAFGATATPELTKALMRRPPRQPAGVKVPQAKVLNVVPAPSHGKVYPLSVSLLRVGVTSELRLDMQKSDKGKWLVTDVLG